MSDGWNQRLIELSADLHRRSLAAAETAKTAELENRRNDAFRGLGVAEGLATASELALAAARGAR